MKFSSEQNLSIPTADEEETLKPKFDKAAWNRRVKEDLEESFKIFDINGDGKISINELQAVMKSVGNNISLEEAQDILQYIDSNGDGGISYDEFQELMYDRMYEGTVEEDLQGCFSIFDIDGDGFISPMEVQELFKKLGALITPDEAVEIMADCDLNNDGLIDFDEFKAFYEKINLQQMEAASSKNKKEEEEGKKEISPEEMIASPDVFK